jgi:hypothetical protein
MITEFLQWKSVFSSGRITRQCALHPIFMAQKQQLFHANNRMDQTFLFPALWLQIVKKHMSEVHHADRLQAVYESDCHSKNWSHRLFWGMLEMAFINACVIYCQQFD